jgi:glycerol-3-phosphate acyltransferase PlsY
VFALIIVVTRYVSLASTGAAVAAAVAAPAMVGWGPSAAAVAVMAALIVWRHRSNFTRLLAGQEAKIGSRKPTPPAEQA